MWCNHGTLQGVGPYANDIKKLEEDIKTILKRVNEKMGVSRRCAPRCTRCGAHKNACAQRVPVPLPGVKETDTGLAPPNLWDLQADKMMMQEEQPLQVRCQS